MPGWPLAKAIQIEMPIPKQDDQHVTSGNEECHLSILGIGGIWRLERLKRTSVRKGEGEVLG